MEAAPLPAGRDSAGGAEGRDNAEQPGPIGFVTHPDAYQHWKIEFDGPLAFLTMDVQEDKGLFPGCGLKLNSYDLGVDIELADAVQRLRFEHPEVGAVVLRSAKDRVFCAGANIGMLGRAGHSHKVNFCKFTNETRLAIEDAAENSRQPYLCLINGTAAGGGYELALATAHILLVDDGSSTVSLPELPLLGVLPGTGGLTRLVDKRKLRRDRADVLCTLVEGIKGKRALEWGLVDELAPLSRLEETARTRAREFAARSDRPRDGKGIRLDPLNREFKGEAIRYDHLNVEFDREAGTATLTIHAPETPLPDGTKGIEEAGCRFWPLSVARQLDDAILHLRHNEPEIGSWIFRTRGEMERVAEADRILLENAGDWRVREITLYWKRVLKRIDVSARSLFALVEPGSCFVGSLLELVLAADRSFMLEGTMGGKEGEGGNLAPARMRLTGMNFGPLPMGNGLSRLATRLLGEPGRLAALEEAIGTDLDARAAAAAGLVTFTPDDIDWEDEVRIALEERASFSPDALSGMEASLRFAGPETLETKIFGRLSAWQNWIFQRPNAVGERGALTLYGSGRQAEFDNKRV
jgi:benzoyl-CoA-dihydrodiol lyase